MTRQLALAIAGGLVAVALVAAALTGVFANDDRAKGDSAADGRPAPTATAVPGIAPGEPTPPGGPTSRPDTPVRPPPTSPPLGAPLPGTVRILAPIESAQVEVLESFPPQYRLQVKAGLPNGCAKPGGYEVTRSGNDVRVAVYDTMPSGNPVCTQIYGTYDVSIDLGTGFVPGQEYRVNVNGTPVTFRAQ